MSEPAGSEELAGDTRPAAAKPQAIFIVGMHRSGTSALARLVNLLGANLGDDLLPPAADNEAGFWEHRAIVQTQERLLQALGHTWTSVTDLPAGWCDLEVVQPFQKMLAEVAQREFATAPLWAIKDPRLCFTLPLWERVLGPTCDIKCALIVRNPAEVVRSLAKRDGMRASRGYMLWLHSLIASERDSRKLARSLTRYESLLADWRSSMRSLGQSLGVRWPVPVHEIEAAAAEFVRPSLRHHAVSDQALLQDESVPLTVRRAYEAAMAAAEAESFDGLSPVLDEIHAELADERNPWMSFATALEDDYQRERIAGHEVNLQRLGMISQLQEHLTTVRAVAEHHQRESASLTTQLSESQARVEDLHHQALNLQERLAMSEQHARQLQQHAENLQAIRQALELREAAALARVRQLEETREHLEGEVASLSLSLQATLGERDAFRSEAGAYRLDQQLLLDLMRQTWSSRSWKLTSPLRGMGRMRLTEARLVAHSPMEVLAHGRWRTIGPAQFLLPCHPVEGEIQIRLTIESTAATEARVYFDTGRLFNDDQCVRLGRVEPGVNALESRVHLAEPVYCFRLDPVQTAADFEIRTFEITTV